MIGGRCQVVVTPGHAFDDDVPICHDSNELPAVDYRDPVSSAFIS
jgi:hypothetical protein